MLADPMHKSIPTPNGHRPQRKIQTSGSKLAKVTNVNIATCIQAKTCKDAPAKSMVVKTDQEKTTQEIRRNAKFTKTIANSVPIRRTYDPGWDSCSMLIHTALECLHLYTTNKIIKHCHRQNVIIIIIIIIINSFGVWG